jgi:hypothetical protein
MVDRAARDKAIRLIEQYFDGVITNDQLLDDFPKSSSDPALLGIHRRLFDIVSDMYSHTIVQLAESDPPIKDLIERCLMFLGSDFEYRWPSLLSRVFAAIRRSDEESRAKTGEPDVWPFFTTADYKSK